MKFFSKRWGRVALLAMLLGVLVLGLTTSGFTHTAQAAEFRGDNHAVIDADEVIDDDLFISGEKVEVNGTVKGDVFAAANEIIINGDIEGSLFLGGQTLQVNGNVKGSVYGGGYSLIIGREAKIGRNLYFGGFSLKTEQSSSVGHSVYGTGYQIILNGNVAGDVYVQSGALEIYGTVEGNVEGQVSGSGNAPPFMPNFPGSVPMVDSGYRVDRGAEIEGESNVVIADKSIDIGETVAGYAWRILRGRLGEYITLLLIGGLLLWLWPGMIQSTTTAAQKKPLPSAGWGCLVTLVFPLLLVIAIIALVIIALLVGLVTFGQLTAGVVAIGAVSIAWIAIVFNFMLFTVTKVIVALAVGRLIMTGLTPRMKPVWLNVSSLALGALIYEILRVIPIVGWIVAFATILIGLGAIFIAARQATRSPAPTSFLVPPDINTPPEIPEPIDEPETLEESEISDETE